MSSGRIKSIRRLNLKPKPSGGEQEEDNHINIILDGIHNDDIDTKRRSFLLQGGAPLFAAALTIVTTLTQNPTQVLASTMEKANTTKLTSEEAALKFQEGYKTINYLLDNYDQICEGGGDNVRRYLGTIVGNPPSPLVGISKVLVALEDRADDFVEYKEMSDELVKSINQADGSAYMSIFVSTSTSYTPPKKYFDDAKVEVKRCKKAMNEVAQMVGITL